MSLIIENNIKNYNRVNNYLFNNIPNGKKILDVGCNTGLLGKKLRNKKNCIVYGVDISNIAIKKAKKNLNFAYQMDIITDELPYCEKFDIIVFGDVLEHTPCPEQVLLKFKKYLVPTGIIIASIPNVANILTRARLLFGNWDYQPSGIMDKTHLRFFTKKTARELFNKTNLKILKWEYIPLGVNKLKTISSLLCYIYPKLFSMQFLIISTSAYSE